MEETCLGSNESNRTSRGPTVSNSVCPSFGCSSDVLPIDDGIHDMSAPDYVDGDAITLIAHSSSAC